ncbi:NADH dehydrogenase [ubiquinone] 1 alpha subcomplex subunit 6 [Capsicum annuum]|uniref:NADH dehydrogenase [ubiquinone] 1 alpha subcomplex subunit 6 n=1 Tax=Capsicum annuum TaxID=4072 RepID=A0A2G2YBF8_CAPAN|nr:NADH dehydrogenase [ubiquinone] 1 alpha subcomplex subunit 6 [Capsicum annuum]
MILNTFLLETSFSFFLHCRAKQTKKSFAKMAQMARSMRVPPNSTSLSEAKKRTLEFFRMCCRSIPEIMDIYNLYDVVTPSQLRSAVASEVRKNSNVTNPKVLFSLIPFS